MGFKEYAIGFVIGAGVSMTGTAYLLTWALLPKQAYTLTLQADDLNQDRIPDLVIEQGQAHKVPMYGIRDGKNIRYVSASEMMKRNPNSMINYKTIESKLNE
ncbi:MAG: hypothetical protein AABW88_03190 [Nanoarchaeota archaeon]|mgnify:FL=1